jgi:acyl-CoA synthetase (NDP forming)
MTDLSRTGPKPDLRRLLAPRSIAIIGASERPNAPGRRVLETLQKLGFAGAIAPIHPSNATVLGLKCFRSLADVPGEIDAVAFCIDARNLPDAMRQAAAKHVGAGVVYGPIGDASIRAVVTTLARQHGIALCGPNCMGAISPVNRSTLYLQTLLDASRLVGNVALVTQSGSIAVGMLGDCRRFGFSHLISSGEESVTTIDQYMEFLIDDPATAVIALFIEVVRNVEGFAAALDRAAAVGKPVAALKVGRSALARDAVVGHTGGIAGDGRVFSALMARHHGIELSSLEEMTEVLACFQAPRRPAGPCVGVVTASGGQVEMILDEASGAPFELPPLDAVRRELAATVIGPISGTGNPLDAWGTGDYTKSLAHGLDVLSGSPDIDSVVLLSDTNDGQTMSPTRYTDLLYDASQRSTKPFYFMNTRSNLMRMELVDKFRGSGVGMITGLRQGLGALGRVGRWAQRSAVAPAIAYNCLAADQAWHEMRPATRRSINEVDAKTILRRLGLNAVDDHVVATAREAVQAAATIGSPVVLKAVSDDIPHRSEHGLVAVGLDNADALVRAFADHDHRLSKLGFDPAAIRRVVQPVAPKGVEMNVGIGHDPEFGLYVAVGAGGVLVELVADAAVKPLPLRSGEALEMVRATKAFRLLSGYRGAPPCDIAALVNCIERVAGFAFAHRDSLREIDLNPIFVGAEGRGCVIADALMVPAQPE